MAQDQFIDALRVSDARWKIRQARPKTLDEALTLAVELETFRTAERERSGVTQVMHTSPEDQTEACRKTTLGLQKEIEDLKNQIKRLSPQEKGRSRRPGRGCWTCGRMGHLQRECPDGKYRGSQWTEQPENHQSQRTDKYSQSSGNGNLPGPRA